MIVGKHKLRKRLGLTLWVFVSAFLISGVFASSEKKDGASKVTGIPVMTKEIKTINKDTHAVPKPGDPGYQQPSEKKEDLPQV